MGSPESSTVSADQRVERVLMSTSLLRAPMDMGR